MILVQDYTGLPRSMTNADQNHGIDQKCLSMPIDSDQSDIDRHWSELISIDQHWSELIDIGINARISICIGNIDQRSLEYNIGKAEIELYVYSNYSPFQVAMDIHYAKTWQRLVTTGILRNTRELMPMIINL